MHAVKISENRGSEVEGKTLLLYGRVRRADGQEEM